jgi:hypothetical protein
LVVPRRQRVHNPTPNPTGYRAPLSRRRKLNFIAQITINRHRDLLLPPHFIPHGKNSKIIASPYQAGELHAPQRTRYFKRWFARLGRVQMAGQDGGA